MNQLLENLRLRIQTLNQPETSFEQVERLSIVSVHGFYHIDFYGTSFGEAYLDLCDSLRNQDIAEKILSFSLRGPDEGANGTNNWDIEPLINGGHTFSHLKSFSIARSEPGDHNMSIVGSEYAEDGIIAKLVAKCPSITDLSIPSAPSFEFFQIPLPSLHFLSVDAGYDCQSFIRNLAHAKSLPSLRSFEWGEYSQDCIEDCKSSCTPFTDYFNLFQSKPFQTVKRFVLRQPNLTSTEIMELKNYVLIYNFK